MPELRRLKLAPIVGAITGGCAFVLVGGLVAGRRGEDLSGASLLDAFIVIGPGVVAVSYAAILLIGWPVIGVLKNRGRLSWWHFAAVGTVAASLESLLFWRAWLMLSISLVAAVIGATVAWAFVVWPSFRASIAV